MRYLILQIVFCLTIAAMLGFVFGWLLRGIAAKHRERDLTEQSEKTVKALKQRLHSARSKQIPADQTVKSVTHGKASPAETDSTFNQAPIEDYYIEVIEGIGQRGGRLLREEGVSMVQEFLERYCHADHRREELADKLDVDEETVRRWVSMADLMRVKGIGSQYAELLEACGIQSVSMLAQQNPEQLAKKLKLVNRAEHLAILSLPDIVQIKGWIDSAQLLPSVISI